MLKHGGQFEEAVIDFSVNVNPVITEEMMGALLEANRDKALCYPEIDGGALERYIQERNNIKDGCVYLGNGASDCIYQLARTVKPKSVLVVEPTFTEYKRAFELNGAVVLPLIFKMETEQGQMEAQLKDQIRKIKADMVVLCNPNNPTGHCYSDDFILEVTKIQKVHKGYVLVDESFRFFESVDSCYDKDQWNLIVLTSLTKYYGIPGLRIGYLTSNFSLIETMKSVQVPWTVNGLALSCTESLMRDEDLTKATEEWYQNERKFLWDALMDVSYIEPIASRANYFLCRLKDVLGTELNEWLLKQETKVAVRTCTDFDSLGDGYIRIGFKSHEDNALLMTYLKAYEEVI